MALTATRILPPDPEILPMRGGRVIEAWRLTGDGSDVAVDIAPKTMAKVEAVIGSTASKTISGTTITLTHATALGNGLIEEVLIIGRGW